MFYLTKHQKKNKLRINQKKKKIIKSRKMYGKTSTVRVVQA